MQRRSAAPQAHAAIFTGLPRVLMAAPLHVATKHIDELPALPVGRHKPQRTLGIFQGVSRISRIPAERSGGQEEVATGG